MALLLLLLLLLLLQQDNCNKRIGFGRPSGRYSAIDAVVGEDGEMIEEGRRKRMGWDCRLERLVAHTHTFTRNVFDIYEVIFCWGR